jgi:hypothetical protein
MDQVEANLNSIESASKSALEIVEATPTDLEVICPLVSKQSLQAELGVDLSTIVQSVATDYNRLREEVTTQISTGNRIVDKIGNGVVQLEGSVATTEQYMWAIPALSFGISVLSAISILGVILAWKEKSDARFQRTMSWVVLPLLILASIACWMVVVFASMGSMIGTGQYMAVTSFPTTSIIPVSLTICCHFSSLCLCRLVPFEFSDGITGSNDTRNSIASQSRKQ